MTLWRDLRLKWSSARSAWRNPGSRRPVYVRNYQAAERGRLFSNWASSGMPADAYIREGLSTMRARSRERMRNDVYARRFKVMAQSHVVGPCGIVLQVRASDSSGILDTVGNDAVEGAWRRWGQGGCDITGRMSWVEMQRLAIGALVEDGEFLIRVHTGGRTVGDGCGVTLQFLDPGLLDVDLNMIGDTGKNDIVMGIERDGFGRPVAYHMTEPLAALNPYETYHSGEHRVISAEHIIHGFICEHVGQSRGVPWLASAMVRMQQLDAFLEASLQNARAGACNMGFFTSDDGDGYAGDGVAADGSLEMEMEPGQIRQLPGGVGFEPFDPTYPDGELAPFSAFMLRSVAAGLGVSYTGLSGDLTSVNYSSARVGLLEERDLWMALQNWLVRVMCEPIYRRWLGLALPLGAVTLPRGKKLPGEAYAKFINAAWQPRRWQWVDPLKDSQSSVLNISSGLMSPSEVIRERGRDPDEVWREIERDKERLSKLGLSLSGEPGESEGGDYEDD